MKLIIQIPCYNEEETLNIALDALPRRIDGIDEIEYMIINDGSKDKTVEVAKAWGVHHIVNFRRNKGLIQVIKYFRILLRIVILSSYRQPHTLKGCCKKQRCQQTTDQITVYCLLWRMPAAGAGDRFGSTRFSMGDIMMCCWEHCLRRRCLCR